MGKRGPQRKNQALAKIEGTYRPDRHGADEVALGLKFVSSIPDVPEELGTHGKKLWVGIIAKMIDLGGWLSETDLPNMKILCMEWDTLHYCAEQRAGAESEKEWNKWDLRYDRSFKRYVNLRDSFGLSASSRTRIKLESPKGEKFDEFEEETV